MALKGTEKEQKNYSKYVGLFNANVVAVNPTKTELEKLLGTKIEKDPEYTGNDSDTGAKKVTLSFWLKEENQGNLFNVRFNMQDTAVVAKSGKKQWIDNIGNTSYADSPSQVPQFIQESGRPLRQAMKGEELLYKFLRAWLNDLNYQDLSTELVLDDWKGLMKGNTTELRAAIDGYQSKTVAALATVRTAEDGKEYQGVYSYEFLPSYAMKAYVEGSKKQYKNVDKFIEKVNDPEYGCKDYYELRSLVEYDPKKNIVGSTNAAVIKPQPTKTAAQPSMANVAEDDLPF